jgi:hypothetical protein
MMELADAGNNAEIRQQIPSVVMPKTVKVEGVIAASGNTARLLVPIESPQRTCKFILHLVRNPDTNAMERKFSALECKARDAAAGSSAVDETASEPTRIVIVGDPIPEPHGVWETVRGGLNMRVSFEVPLHAGNENTGSPATAAASVASPESDSNLPPSRT